MHFLTRILNISVKKKKKQLQAWYIDKDIIPQRVQRWFGEPKCQCCAMNGVKKKKKENQASGEFFPTVA